MRIRAFVATGLLAAGGCFGNGGVLTPAEFVRLTGTSPAAETQGTPIPALRAMGQPLPSTGAGGATNQSPANLKPRLMTAGMVISVAVEEDRSLSRQFVVPNSGALDYPPLGRLEVAGLTTDELAQRIKTQLERDYFNTATVRVAVESATTGGGVIYVLGSVNRPGPLLLPADESFTVTKVIIAAGNLSTFGNGAKVRLIRYGESGKKYETQVNVARIMQRGEFDKDIPVRNGDWIIVPEKLINF
jgi:polysaccharide export outer membrane protein